MSRFCLAALAIMSIGVASLSFAADDGDVQFELQAEYERALEKYARAQEEIARLKRQLQMQSSSDDYVELGLQQVEFEVSSKTNAIEDGIRQAAYRRMNQSQGGMGGGSGGPGGGGGGDVATQSQNPVGGLWMMWLQNDMKLLEGPGDGKRIFNTTVFQPVMPVQLTDTWKVINRPVFMFNTFEVPSNFNFRPGGNQDPVFPPTDPFATEAGLGDIAFIQWLSNSPADSKFVTGFGWNWMFPAASDRDLGTGLTSVGPSAVCMYLGDKIIAGGIMQQYFSIKDEVDPRIRVSLMDLQYVFRYRLNPMFSIGFAPNMQWDQVTGVVTMPVGFGFDTMTMAGCGMPIRWGAELQYFASHENSASRQFDPEWNFRLYVSPIIKAPEWATKGLFSGGPKCRKCNR